VRGSNRVKTLPRAAAQPASVLSPHAPRERPCERATPPSLLLRCYSAASAHEALLSLVASSDLCCIVLYSWWCGPCDEYAGRAAAVAFLATLRLSFQRLRCSCVAGWRFFASANHPGLLARFRTQNHAPLSPLPPSSRLCLSRHF